MSDLALPRPVARRRAALWALRSAPLLALVVMELAFWLCDPRILSGGNLVNLLRQSTYLVILATAQTLVILTRGFDLSIGAMVSVSSVATSLVLTGLSGGADDASPLVLVAGMLTGLGVGALVGLFNGVCVAWLRVNPFVATLGSLNICVGLATTISGGTPVFGVPDNYSVLLSDGTVLGVPDPAIIAVVLCVIVWFGLERTVPGRALFLIGSNPRAAHVAGLPERRYVLLAYVACSVLGAIASLLLTARTGSGEPNLGGGLMLESIAAAVIGGASLAGGQGGIGTAVLGGVFVTALANGMDLLQIGGYTQQLILGVVIIAAVTLDRVRSQRL